MLQFIGKREVPETLEDCDSMDCGKCLYGSLLPMGDDMLGQILDCHIRGLLKKIEFPESK